MHATLAAVATVVCFHAHPDDEALLTGGTLAMLSAQGHRVVLVVASDGIMGPADSGKTGPGGRSRLDELTDAASALGAAQVVHLGYADSGHGPVLFPDPPDRQRFVRADIGQAAARLAAVLEEEHADLLISYDEAGGYARRGLPLHPSLGDHPPRGCPRVRGAETRGAGRAHIPGLAGRGGTVRTSVLGPDPPAAAALPPPARPRVVHGARLSAGTTQDQHSLDGFLLDAGAGGLLAGAGLTGREAGEQAT